MARTLRLNCQVCGSPHLVDEDELFTDAEMSEADYVAGRGSEAEHQLQVRRPPPRRDPPPHPLFGPYRP